MYFVFYFALRDFDFPKLSYQKNNSTDTVTKNEDNKLPAIYKGKIDNLISKRNGYFNLVILTILYLFITYFIFWPEILSPVLKTRRTSVIGLMGFTFQIGLTIAYFNRLFEGLFKINNWRVNNEHGLIKFTTSIFFVFAFFGVLSLITIFRGLLHSSFLLPQDFKNKQYIDCKIKSQHDLRTFKIEYFNDKYIFVRIIDQTGKEIIEVLEFEDFFKSDACDNTPKT